MQDADIIIHIGPVVRKLVQCLRAVLMIKRQPLKQLVDHLFMILVEKTAENGLSLHGVKVIHDHLIIMTVTFAGHKQEFILLVAETDIPKRPVQLLEFRLGVLHILLQLGQELLPELLLGGLPCALHLLFIAEQFGTFQLAIFRLEIRISFQRGRRAEVVGSLVFHHGICHGFRTFGYGGLVGLPSAGKVLLELFVAFVL